jgi:hypothetical protein
MFRPALHAGGKALHSGHGLQIGLLESGGDGAQLRGPLMNIPCSPAELSMRLGR